MVFGPLIALALVILACLFIYQLSLPLRQILRIRATPTTALGMLPAVGTVETVGQVLSDLGPSPISGRPCALWQIEVQELRRSGKSSAWRTIYKQTSSSPFTVDDGTGQALINPAAAELVLNTDLQEQRGFFSSLSPEIVSALERIGIPTTGFLGFQRNLRVIERLITAGETIFVLGTAAYAEGAKTIRSAPEGALILSDRSESDLLGKLYLQVAGWVLLIALLAGVVLVVPLLLVR